MLNRQDITYGEAKELKARAFAEDLQRGLNNPNTLNLEPLNDRVLLRRVNQDDSKAVKIAEAFQPRSNRGEVLRVGPAAAGILKAGDQVLFSHYSAQDIEVQGEELVIISIHDIWLRL